MTLEKGTGTYNVVVIGAGTAGLVVAAGTAGLGGRVALIEKNKMGGDCLNYGCVPSKALISSARLICKIQSSAKWGLHAMEPRFEFNALFDRMRKLRATLAPNDSQERFESLGVDIFRGAAKFRSANAVEVDGVELKARNFVIATGTHPALPQVEGLADVKYFTNETIFDELHEKPESMIVLGGGPVGCELSWVMHRFGVKVTLVQRGPRLLPKEDEDVGACVARRFAESGLKVMTNAEVALVKPDLAGVAMKFADGKTLTATHLLIATGRAPNIQKLGLPRSGVEADGRGVKVNDYLQTTVPHIYAAGDVAGPYRFTHVADAQARVVVRNILMPFQLMRQKMDYSVVPWCTYLDPEIATVGLNESAARKNGVAYDLIVQKVEEVDRAILESEAHGFIKVLLAKGSDRILGTTIVCEHAGELIHEFALAIKNGLGMGKIGRTIHAYPTYSELARKTADRYSKTRFTPFVQKVFAWRYERDRGA